jgi:uncharacterized oxidoreductase
MLGRDLEPRGRPDHRPRRGNNYVNSTHQGRSNSRTVRMTPRLCTWTLSRLGCTSLAFWQRCHLSENNRIVDHKQLSRLAEALLIRAGSDGREALLIAEHLVEANLSGHDSHGIGLLPHYLQGIREGRVFPGRRAKVVRDCGAVVVLDGQFGFGQVVAQDAMAIGVERAKRYGVAVIALRQSHHLGRIASWGEIAAAKGYISIHYVNSSGGSPIVAPFGGREARLSTNPYCTVFPPTRKPSVMVDMATSKIALGKARVARAKGDSLPDGVAIDVNGNPCVDPGVLFTEPAGALLPMGEHKGYSLAVVCELLAGALTGGGTAATVRNRQRLASNNMLTIVIDPERLSDRASFIGEVDALVDYLGATKPLENLEGRGAVLLPGETERNCRRDRLSCGIPIEAETWRGLCDVATELGLSRNDVELLIQ